MSIVLSNQVIDPCFLQVVVAVEVVEEGVESDEGPC